MLRTASRSEILYFQKLKQKKFRKEYDQFIGEGLNLFKQIKTKPDWFLFILVDETFYFSNPDEFAGLPSDLFRTVSKKALSGLSETENPQPVLFVLNNLRNQTRPDFASMQRVLYLFGLQDPGNAGTLLRTAAWFGWDAVVFSHDSVDWTNPKVIRSSMGSFVSCQVYEDTRDRDLLKKAGNLMAGYFLELEGESIHRIRGTKHPVCLVVGNEANGYSGFDPQSVFSESMKILIPGHPGRIESLNAGVAGTIALFQLSGMIHFDK